MVKPGLSCLRPLPHICSMKNIYRHVTRLILINRIGKEWTRLFYQIIMPLGWGLFVFLGGMKIMESGLRKLAGPMLQRGLQHATASPLRGLLVSTGITALLQSSSAVTVITIGMVNAGLLTYGRTLGIILGTNIGTCLTTELMGLQLGTIALPLLVLSILSWILAVLWYEHTGRGFGLQFVSLAFAGFALIMTGIRIMQAIGPWVEEAGMFQWFLTHATQNMWWAFIAGACLTAIMHSGVAVIGIAMSLAATGALPLDVAIAIVIGSNVGTCVTAWMASFGGSTSGKFVAWTHILLNVAGALIFMPLIPWLQTAATLISSEAGAQVAHAQTLFNLISSLLALPLCYLPIWTRLDQTGEPKDPFPVVR